MTDAKGAAVVVVLVVEDEPFIRWDVTDYLRNTGLTVLEAADADQALCVLETCDVQVVFTDVNMPGSMDGLQLASLIRNRWPCTALIITSGHAALSEIDLPSNSRFFRKPYQSAVVAQAIEELVRD